MQWKYISQLDVTACMERLSDPDIGSADELNPFRVEITRLSDSQVYLVYKGRRFSKARRTEYLVSLLPDTVSSITNITVVFRKELFGLPCAMTPVSDLDDFMRVTMYASRIA